MNCRQGKWDKVKQAVDEEDHTFAFKVGQVDEVLVSAVKEKGLMVDTGATSHIIETLLSSRTLTTVLSHTSMSWSWLMERGPAVSPGRRVQPKFT